MRIILVIALLSAACGQSSPTAPTPNAPKVVAVTPVSLGRIEVTIDVMATSILVSAWDAANHETDVDAICSASSGAVVPTRLTGRGAALARLRDQLPVPLTVTCWQGDHIATARADLSAWTIRIGEVLERLNTRGKWETQLTAQLISRNMEPATARAIDWGDGQLESIRGGGLALAIPLAHVYATTGDFEIRARVEWSAGTAEARGVLSRFCYTPPVIPIVINVFGICTNTWRELQ